MIVKMKFGKKSCNDISKLYSEVVGLSTEKLKYGEYEERWMPGLGVLNRILRTECSKYRPLDV